VSAPRSSAVSDLLATLDGPAAQLLLSLLVWPDVAPLPCVVDEWIRRQEAANSEPHAAFLVAALPVPSHFGHTSTMRPSSLGPGT